MKKEMFKTACEKATVNYVDSYERAFKIAETIPECLPMIATDGIVTFLYFESKIDKNYAILSLYEYSKEKKLFLEVEDFDKNRKKYCCKYTNDTLIYTEKVDYGDDIKKLYSANPLTEEYRHLFEEDEKVKSRFRHVIRNHSDLQRLYKMGYDINLLKRERNTNAYTYMQISKNEEIYMYYKAKVKYLLGSGEQVITYEKCNIKELHYLFFQNEAYHTDHWYNGKENDPFVCLTKLNTYLFMTKRQLQIRLEQRYSAAIFELDGKQYLYCNYNYYDIYVENTNGKLSYTFINQHINESTSKCIEIVEVNNKNIDIIFPEYRHSDSYSEVDKFKIDDSERRGDDYVNMYMASIPQYICSMERLDQIDKWYGASIEAISLHDSPFPFSMIIIKINDKVVARYDAVIIGETVNINSSKKHIKVGYRRNYETTCEIPSNRYRTIDLSFGIKVNGLFEYDIVY